MRIVITGAAGTIGRLAVAALAESHDLVLIDRRPTSGAKAVRADLSIHPLSDPLRPRSWLQRWPKSFEGADAVVHLAANPHPAASWWRILRHNIKATWNVLGVATSCSVPKVVFASSNWAIAAARIELGSAGYEPAGPKVAWDAPPRPQRAYGVSKGFGEIAGRALVDEGRLRSFLSLRIGHCSVEGRAHVDTPYLRHHWIGHRDMQDLIRRCVEQDLSGFHVLYAVSAQPEAPYDLSYTKELLGWEPKECAEPLELEPSA